MSQFMERVSKNCARYPDRASFVDSTRSMTYRKLWEESGKVCSWIKANGMGKEDFCLILLPRSVSTLASILGVLRSGCAFCNIDSSYPSERVAYSFGTAAKGSD